MYTGAGVAPMLASGAAWNAIAAELSTSASSFESVVVRLTSEHWRSPAALSMAAAVQPLVVWLEETAESAALAAGQALASAAAYESAYAATVPPAEVAANRARLAALTATNIFGQNVSAIAALEARYGEMWAQDAAAMYGYAASSAAAARLNPLTAPMSPAESNGTADLSAVGAAQRATLSSLVGNGPATLMGFASPAEAGTPTEGMNTFLATLAMLDHEEIPLFEAFHHNVGTLADFTTNTPVSGVGNGDDDDADVDDDESHIHAEPEPRDSGVLAGGGATPLAGASLPAVGTASSVGALLVPPNWSGAVPVSAEHTVVDGTYWAVPEAEEPDTAIPPAPGMVVSADGGNAPAGPRYGVKPTVVPPQRFG